ncbi:unnamed protein product [Echinostoma caproni]|uniref:Velvet domain-containing protein n=1 Tax=Echinostoma caproni TaxID=27848 RepID=A0A183AAX8_9TREM|nr:unnamed protein product [Echinostoma caproni]
MRVHFSTFRYSSSTLQPQSDHGFIRHQSVPRNSVDPDLGYVQYPNPVAPSTDEPQTYHLVRQAPPSPLDYSSQPRSSLPNPCVAPVPPQQSWAGPSHTIEWPPNPYHVPPAGVFYRPRGCHTMTDFNDGQSELQCEVDHRLECMGFTMTYSGCGLNGVVKLVAVYDSD